MNIKTSSKGLPTFKLVDTSVATFTGSILSKEQGPESHLHLLNSTDFLFKLAKVLLFKSLHTAGELQKSLQEQDQSNRLVLYG